jgi:hypothetical protein
MQTECSADLFGFARVEGRAVVAVFNGGKITSDAGALPLGATDRAILLVDRFAACFADNRTPALIEHTVRALVGQRVFALALGYEDLVDHDDLTMAVLAGKCSVIPTGRSTAARDQLRLGGGKEPAADIGCAADTGLERGRGPDQAAHRGGGNIG